MFIVVNFDSKYGTALKEVPVQHRSQRLAEKLIYFIMFLQVHCNQCRRKVRRICRRKKKDIIKQKLQNIDIILRRKMIKNKAFMRKSETTIHIVNQTVEAKLHLIQLK